MNKTPEFDFHKPFLVSLLVIVVFVFGFGVMGKTQKNVNQNGAAVALSKTTTTAGPPNPGQTVAQKVFLMGGNTGSQVLNDAWSSSNLATNIWLQNTNIGPWLGIPQGVYFKNKLWMIGGYSSPGTFPQVVSSIDGTHWVIETSNVPWPHRNGHTILVFNDGGGDALWMFGGGSSIGLSNDVWKSYDGVNWVQVIAHAAWTPRLGHSSLVFDNKMWVIGGNTGLLSGSLPEAWYSTDGINWTQAISSPAWDARVLHSSVVFNNKMWVIGGGLLSSPYNNASDVWSSPDGINWTQVTAHAPWGPRVTQASVVFDNKMWVLGGSAGGNPFNDVWSSSDGINWNASTPPNALWIARQFLAVVVTPATFGLPDLTITNLTFRNQPIHVSTTNPYVYYDVTVKNNSSTVPVVLPATGNTFQINLTSIPSAVPSGDLATITVGTPITLQPGQSHTFSNVSTRYDSTIRATARTYRITAKADALNLITELNETNNTYATNLTIIP